MTTDTKVPESLAAALAVLQTRLPRISKDKTARVTPRDGGAGYQYKYADLANITEALMPVLGELGLSFSAKPTMADGAFGLVYVLRHVSGEHDGGFYPLSNRGTPQQIGGEITYARRYVLCAITGLALDDDDDAQAAQRAASRREQRDQRGRGAANNAAGEPGLTGAQQRELQDLYGKVGLADKASKLAYAVRVIKRQIGTATQLTAVEADQVIKSLKGDIAAAENRNEHTP